MKIRTLRLRPNFLVLIKKIVKHIQSNLVNPDTCVPENLCTDCERHLEISAGNQEGIDKTIIKFHAHNNINEKSLKSYKFTLLTLA